MHTYKAKNKKDMQSGGFLLIEMLVAVFIFTIVMLVSLSAVLALVDANRKNQSIKSVVNNLNLVVNGIVKNIAVSSNYYCGLAGGGYPQGYEGGSSADCTDIDTPIDCAEDPDQCSITFLFNEDTNGDDELDVIRYKYEETDSTNHTGRILKSVDSTNQNDYIPVTAPEVKITGMNFFVFDTEPLQLPINANDDVEGTAKQPRVILIINGYAGTKDITKSQFRIQTTVSQRSLDAIYYE